MAVAMILIFPVTLLRKMTALKFTSVISVMSMLVLAFVVLYRDFNPTPAQASNASTGMYGMVVFELIPADSQYQISFCFFLFFFFVCCLCSGHSYCRRVRRAGKRPAPSGVVATTRPSVSLGFSALLLFLHLSLQRAAGVQVRHACTISVSWVYTEHSLVLSVYVRARVHVFAITATLSALRNDESPW